MSFFGVETRKIESIRPHSNADRLEIGKLVGLGFPFVVKKGEFVAGQEVVYFPIDSVLPQSLIAHLGVGNFMAGKDHNRFKSVRLRGELSQGFVCTKETINDFFQKTAVSPESNMKIEGYFEDSEILTMSLGVTKYEPPAVMAKGARLLPLFGTLYSYDIEGCDRHPEIVEMLMDRIVMISEKVEGMNFGASKNRDDREVVNQRNFIIETLPDHPEHTFWTVAKNEHFLSTAAAIRDKYYPGQNVTIRGEFVGPGVQGNYYDLKTHTAFAFEIEVDGQPIDVNHFLGLCREFGIKTVPILSEGKTLREWLNGKTVQEASNGKSVLVDKLREGIVIKPMDEERIDGFGRLFIKQRSGDYLANTEN
jgi:RNA ligase (TIGR02306 family)